MAPDTGPWRLVGQLQAWAESTWWCDSLELGGSLGRGAGDEMSDVDAGLGVADGVPYDEALRLTREAILGFAPVADSMVQPYGEASNHLVVQYEDGRQLSLVVSPASRRKGLPPGALALLDRKGILGQPWSPEVLAASVEQQREWAFLAWWGLGDVAKHARRGQCWRALHSLDEARDLVWRLHAAALGVDYPSFGAVSVENAGLPAPAGIADSLPAAVDPGAILAAAAALASVLDPLAAPFAVERLRTVVLRQLRD